MRKINWVVATLVMSSFVFAGCEDDDKTDDGNGVGKENTYGNGNEAGEGNGRIASNKTLPDRCDGVDYIIDGVLNIEDNALLTVEPGVTIMFTGKNGGIHVGDNAGLKMVGTESKPIVLTGPTNNQNVGSWGKVTITSMRGDNNFEYVTFKNGGADNYEWSGVVDVEGAKLSIKHCTIDGSLGTGIDVEGDAVITAFEENKIVNCQGYPFYSESVSPLAAIDEKSDLTGNGSNFAYARGSVLSKDYTLEAISVPYYLVGTTTVEKGHFSITEGAEIVMGEDVATIRVAQDGSMSIVGTEKKPVVLRGADGKSDAGAWKNICFNSNNSKNALEWVEFRNGGSEDYEWSAVLDLQNNTKISIKNCTIDGSLTTGIDLEGTVKLTAFEGNVIKNTKLPILVEYLPSALNLTAGNTYDKNEKNYVELRDGSLDGSTTAVLKALEVPYYVANGLGLHDQVSFEIEAGTKLLMAADKLIAIGENVKFIANGTQQKPIVITGADDTESYWEGINYESKMKASVMNYCEISCGGPRGEDGFYGAMLRLYDNTVLTIKNCKFSKTDSYGIALDSPDVAKSITSENITFSGCAKGNVFVEDSETPILTELPK